jgi:hypothetical protein
MLGIGYRVLSSQTVRGFGQKDSGAEITSLAWHRMSQIGTRPEDTIPALKIRTKVCLEQAAKVGLSFATNKSELVHCLPESSRSKMKPLDILPTLTIENRTKSFTAQPTKTIKRLGVIINESLNFLVYIRHAASKGMQSLG